MSDTATGILGFVGMSALAGILVTAAVTPALAVTGMAANNGISMFENLPGYLNIEDLSEKTDIYAVQADGSPYPLASFFDENREEVPWDRISQYVKDAAIAGEDPRFYEHGGVDIQGTIRGAVSTYVLNADVQGGSSITQQYVKNVLINNGVRVAKTEEEKDGRLRIRHRDLPRAQAQGDALRDRAREEVLEGRHPQGLPQHRGIRRPGLRHRVGLAVLLRRQARRRPHPC